MPPQDSILDHPAISGCYLFPQRRCVDDPFFVPVVGAELACYRQIRDPVRLTVVHFHGNGEAVADYVPWMVEQLATLGLNSLFVEYALWEALVPPGGGPPPHVHSREEEGFVILEGEITFQIGDQRLVATAGMFANMPVGTPHSFKNESGKPAKMLISVAPAGLEKMFFEFGVPVAQGATTTPPPTKAEIAKLLEIAPRYGIEIRLPAR